MKNFISLSFLLLMFVVRNTWGIGSEFKLCTATSPATLNACASSVQSGVSDNIKITGNIQCTDAEPCRLNFIGIKGRLISIYGDGPSTSSISRSYNTVANASELVVINGTDSMSLRDFRIDDASCNKCQDTITVVNSTNVVIDRMEILNSKNMGIGIGSTQNFELRRSTISGAKNMGLWFGSGNQGARIENNTITKSGTNGILWNGDNGHITGNTITGNHYAGIYGHSGGQVLIENSLALALSFNTIAYSTFAGPLAAHGIELGGDGTPTSSVRAMEISNNRIYSHDGSGIAFNADTTSYISSTNPSRIVNNYIASNDGGMITLVAGDPYKINGIYYSGNSATSNVATKPTGYFYNTPTTCTLQPGQNACSITLCWTTSGGISPRVLVNGDDALFSWSTGRCQEANWIWANGATFDLYADAEKHILLDSIFVYAKKP